MLQFLRIDNLALMDSVSLECTEGFTAITGETGAGKSVLLGALSLLAGNRAEKTIIRKGADETSVQAILQFSDPTSVNAELEAIGAPPCDEEGALVLRRVLSRKRASRIEINGTVQTLANLQRIGETWIDFHGPGEPQKLFRENCQRGMLDLFAAHGDKLTAYKEQYQQWRSLLQEAEELEGAERLSPDECDFLQKQVDKINRLELTAESLEELEKDYSRLSNAQELTELYSQIAAQLSQNISPAAAEALRTAQEIAQIDSSSSELATRLNSTLLEIEDIASDYETSAQGIEQDEEAIEAIQERMDSWLEVKRKYGPSIEAVLQQRDQIAHRIESQSDIEGSIQKLKKQAAEIESSLKEKAEVITKKRIKTAKDLAAKASTLLGALGFKKAELSIEIIPEQSLQEHGDSTCRFLFRPNAGQDLLPLNKIASSGETARVMLALKTVLAQVDATPVLVFDEVDANVGGEIGAEVGKELARLAGGHQVFCVTHLPQVAAKAAQHYLVEKTQTNKETCVTIEPIHENKDRRLSELARMLGDRKSKSAQSHAAELLGN